MEVEKRREEGGRAWGSATFPAANLAGQGKVGMAMAFKSPASLAHRISLSPMQWSFPHQPCILMSMQLSARPAFSSFYTQGILSAMAALSSSTVAPCCVKPAVSFNGGAEKTRSLRSSVWQMGACPLELRCVVAKTGGAIAPAVTKRRGVVACAAAAATTTDVPTVSDTKAAFIQSYRKPIPSIYSNVIQELLVQQHLMRYNASYTYDSIFALGFVTVYDQLMDGYPSDTDRDAIFKAYVTGLKEDPELYRKDAKKLEEWAAAQSGSGITDFASKDGEVEAVLKGIAERAAVKESFHYSRFFAIGLFRLLECANASDPAVLENLSKALNVSKRSVDRDLDVYRNLLSKLAQGKELIKEYNEREKKKQAERDAAAANSKSAETVAKTEGAKSE